MSSYNLLPEHHLNVVFEALESDEDNGDIVEGAVARGRVENLIGHET